MEAIVTALQIIAMALVGQWVNGLFTNWHLGAIARALQGRR